MLDYLKEYFVKDVIFYFSGGIWGFGIFVGFENFVVDFYVRVLGMFLMRV